MGYLTSEKLTSCILALGWICDQREYIPEMSGDVIQEVFDTIRKVDDYYSVLTAMNQAKASEIAIKMVNGDLLNVDEEQFLLTKFEQ